MTDERHPIEVPSCDGDVEVVIETTDQFDERRGVRARMPRCRCTCVLLAHDREGKCTQCPCEGFVQRQPFEGVTFEGFVPEPPK